MMSQFGGIVNWGSQGTSFISSLHVIAHISPCPEYSQISFSTPISFSSPLLCGKLIIIIHANYIVCIHIRYINIVNTYIEHIHFTMCVYVVSFCIYIYKYTYVINLWCNYLQNSPPPTPYSLPKVIILVNLWTFQYMPTALIENKDTSSAGS